MEKSSEIKEFKIGYTKKHLCFLSLAIIGVTIGALYFIFNADKLAMMPCYARGCIRNSISYRILGLFILCFCTILGSSALFKYIKNPLIFTINEKGIILPEGFVKWNDIMKANLYDMRGSVLLRIKVRARCAKYLRRNYNMFQKFLASLQEKNTFSYSVSGTDVNIDELYGFVRTRIENVRKKY